MVRLNFNKELAEDLLMDVYLKAYEKFKKFDPNKASFKTWIFTIAHNHLVNHWRDNKAHATTSLEYLEEEGVAAAITEPENNAANDIEYEKIQRVLSLMKDSEREMITLRYLEDLDYKEIAAITNKKEGAIRTCLSRAMENFRKFHKKVYPDEKKL
jgi:RNA polymerase sigma-70 factor (ECF subfamily)